jgi:hypothetical protein
LTEPEKASMKLVVEVAGATLIVVTFPFAVGRVLARVAGDGRMLGLDESAY